MAWERRRNKRYYYRKTRQGDKVVSEYVGAGELAQAAADLDAALQQVRRLKQRQWESHSALDAQVDEVCELIRALTHAALLTAGYHTNKGRWRKKRHV